VIRAQLKLIRRLWALKPPRALHIRVLRWVAAAMAREFAWQFSFLLAVIAVVLGLLGATGSTLGLVLLALIALLLLFESRLAYLSIASSRAVDEALRDIPGEPSRLRFPRSHLVLPALMLAAKSVRKERAVVFHEGDGYRLRLDIYRPREATPRDDPRPAVIQVHGGGWIAGSRLEQGIPLLNHLASNGWIGFNVDYRLSPRATLPDHVVDVKRAIAWVRGHAEELNIDPERICLTGGSAGGHLTALAALTADDRSLQPGFEDSDTSVAAAVPFYGVYDMADLGGNYYPELRSWLFPKVVIKREYDDDPAAYEAVSPTYRVHAGAPPFLVFHGDRDTLVPVQDARAFVERLEATSRNHVLYVELPGAEHAFDLAPSLRTAHVVEGIERFLRTAVLEPRELTAAGRS
jgi:acetyl esterase/lipase